MGEGTIPLGERGAAVGPVSQAAAQALGFGGEADSAGSHTEESLLADHLIEEAVAEQDAKDKAKDWQNWIPELEKTFRDRLLSLVGERFKLESIAQSTSERGAVNIEEVLKMISDIEPAARARYPKYSWIDAIYKYLGDTRRG